MLAVDGIFQIHEGVLGQIPTLRQPLCILVYGSLALDFVYLQRELIKSEHVLTFIAAVGFLAISAATDNLRDLSSFASLLEQPGAAKPLEVMSFLLEDTAKLIGILLWLGYAVRKAAQFLRSCSD
ncbi:MAG: hypothetical protein K0U60_04240 [Actinomycetia bacterium]|nr:hypothetical protein [Actinomycetes bacterium]